MFFWKYLIVSYALLHGAYAFKISRDVEAVAVEEQQKPLKEVEGTLLSGDILAHFSQYDKNASRVANVADDHQHKAVHDAAAAIIAAIKKRNNADANAADWLYKIVVDIEERKVAPYIEQNANAVNVASRKVQTTNAPNAETRADWLYYIVVDLDERRKPAYVQLKSDVQQKHSSALQAFESCACKTVRGHNGHELAYVEYPQRSNDKSNELESCSCKMLRGPDGHKLLYAEFPRPAANNTEPEQRTSYGSDAVEDYADQNDSGMDYQDDDNTAFVEDNDMDYEISQALSEVVDNPVKKDPYPNLYKDDIDGDLLYLNRRRFTFNDLVQTALKNRGRKYWNDNDQ